MRRALAADATLLRYRHIVWVISVLAFIAIGLFAAQSIGELSPLTPAQLAQAEETYQSERATWEANHESWEQMCIDDGGSHEQCAVPPPVPEQFRPWQADFPWATRIVLLMTAATLSVAMFVIGATYVGSEFASGALTTWLSQLPGRTVAFASKLITVGYLALGAALCAFGLTLLATYLAARAWDVPVPHADLTDAMVGALNGTALVVLGAVLGAALTFISRRATVTVGLAAAYIFLNRLTFYFGIGVGAAPVLDLISLAHAWVDGGFPLNYWDASGPRETVLTPAFGATTWIVVTAVAVVIAGLVHRRRDLA